MSKQKFKCGNCSNIQSPKLLSNHNYDIRYVCNVCGPLCKDCHSKSLLSYGKCKGCGEEAKAENFRSGSWQ